MKFLPAILLLVFPAFGICKANPYEYAFKKADSLVKCYWGDKNFNKYIRLDSAYSEYCIFHTFWDSSVAVNKPLHFQPNVFCFRYKINTPLFAAIEFPIQFYVDSLGDVMTGFGMDGLAKFGDLDTINLLDSNAVKALAKDSGLSESKKDLETVMVWDDFKDEHGNMFQVDSSNGGYRWVVKSYFAEPYYIGCSRFDYEEAWVDVKTGKFIGIYNDAPSLIKRGACTNCGGLPKPSQY